MNFHLFLSSHISERGVSPLSKGAFHFHSGLETSAPAQKALNSRFNFMLLLLLWPLYYGGTVLAVLKCRAQVDVSSTGSSWTSLEMSAKIASSARQGGHEPTVRVRFPLRNRSSHGSMGFHQTTSTAPR